VHCDTHTHTHTQHVHAHAHHTYMYLGQPEGEPYIHTHTHTHTHVHVPGAAGRGAKTLAGVPPPRPPLPFLQPPPPLELGELPCQLAPEKRKNEKKIENIENPLEDGAVTAPTAMGQLLRQQRWGSYCANSDGAVTAPTMGQLLRQQRWGSYCANSQQRLPDIIAP
jgi:hypothetical protein